MKKRKVEESAPPAASRGKHVPPPDVVAEDIPELTDADFARMRPACEVVLGVVAGARRARGPQKTPTKTQVTLRLDSDIVAHFRAGGRGWQTRLNDALRDLIGKRA